MVPRISSTVHNRTKYVVQIPRLSMVFKNILEKRWSKPPKTYQNSCEFEKKYGPRNFGLQPHLKFLIYLIEPYIISKQMQSHKIKRVKVIKREHFPILGPNRKIYRLL